MQGISLEFLTTVRICRSVTTHIADIADIERVQILKTTAKFEDMAGRSAQERETESLHKTSLGAAHRILSAPTPLTRKVFYNQILIGFVKKR